MIWKYLAVILYPQYVVKFICDFEPVLLRNIADFCFFSTRVDLLIFGLTLLYKAPSTNSGPHK